MRKFAQALTTHQQELTASQKQNSKVTISTVEKGNMDPNELDQFSAVEESKNFYPEDSSSTSTNEDDDSMSTPTYTAQSEDYDSEFEKQLKKELPLEEITSPSDTGNPNAQADPGTQKKISTEPTLTTTQHQHNTSQHRMDQPMRPLQNLV